MGLRMGAMQAPRWQRCADAREPFRHVQARHHGRLLGGPIHGKFRFFFALLLPVFVEYRLRLKPSPLGEHT